MPVAPPRRLPGCAGRSGFDAVLLRLLAWVPIGLSTCVVLGISACDAIAQPLPAEVALALQRAKLPLDAVAMLVVDAQGGSPARLSHRATVAMNPASVMKLVTTFAALDLLGPAFVWTTPVYIDGSVRDGTLFGNLVIKGQGDPKLVVERLWMLLRRVQGLGIRSIRGDIILDNSAFALAESDPGRFDGEALRPYNATPDALLLNYKSLVMRFVPDRSANVALVQVEPPLAGVTVQPGVALAGGDCSDYRGSLRADFSDPLRIRFSGSYPASCLERVWAVAYAEPRSYAARAVEGLWLAMGGKLIGGVRSGRANPAAVPAFAFESPTLAETVRDINKFSNNVMAQQLFLTLSLSAPAAGGALMPVAAEGAPGQVATLEASRDVLRRWWQERLGGDDAPLLDNGSGLSRDERISAQALARMLQTAYRSSLMPELMSSLPIAGVDGTLRRQRSRASGSAHLKTGSLRDVVSIAGYVHAASGKRYVMVAMVNHANAEAARPAFDALLDWVLRKG
ncbi:MAG: D-alanyl-D-alanine carboxypeptidase/D-alanyl-D-alanine-endopeptidase [Betaproteobacteria bacterium]|nr:D-alanyl-D-alanine carboxypeptidase/D-alanyl-D-alanine-endopeptidase [Betaproteobacteria bacterium]